MTEETEDKYVPADYIIQLSDLLGSGSAAAAAIGVSTSLYNLHLREKKTRLIYENAAMGQILLRAQRKFYLIMLDESREAELLPVFKALKLSLTEVKP